MLIFFKNQLVQVLESCILVPIPFQHEMVSLGAEISSTAFPETQGSHGGSGVMEAPSGQGRHCSLPVAREHSENGPKPSKS